MVVYQGSEGGVLGLWAVRGAMLCVRVVMDGILGVRAVIHVGCITGIDMINTGNNLCGAVYVSSV